MQPKSVNFGKYRHEFNHSDNLSMNNCISIEFKLAKFERINYSENESQMKTK